MAIDFPSAPADGEIFVAENQTWKWDAAKSVWYSLGTLNSVNAIVDLLYPVGAIYISVAAANPGTLFPGTTWTAFAAGRAIVGVGTADGLSYTSKQTRGAATHQLTQGEMPSHVHQCNPPAQTFTTSGNNRGHTHAFNPPGGTTSQNGGSHNHDINLDFVYVNDAASGQVYKALCQNGQGKYPNLVISTLGTNIGHDHTFNAGSGDTGQPDQNHTHQVSINLNDFNSQSAGGGGAHNNVQPSIGVYMWERTA